MSKFALEKIDEIRGRQVFFQLLIDGVGQFSQYQEELEEVYQKELFTLISYMDMLANLQRVSPGVMKDITPDKQQIREYEFRSDHLRVYAIKTKLGKIIVLGGYKNNQSKDLSRFRSIKKRYLDSIK